MRTAILASVLYFGVRLASLALIGAGTAVAGEAWQTEWEKVVAEAKREGELGIVVELAIYQPVLEDFKKKYPEIKLSYIGGPVSSDRTQKLMAERRANLYRQDIYIGSLWNSLGEGLYQVGDPIKPALILPEVLDQSKWWGGKHQYEDPKGQYIFIFEGIIKAGDIAYNKNLVNSRDIKSYWDLLSPKWKGKILVTDHSPSVGGSVQKGLRLFNYHPQLGRQFLKRLYGEMDITLSRNQTQMLDWLGAGKVALAFYTSTSATQNAIKQGLPIENFFGSNFKEGGIVVPAVGTISLLDRAPHPNAAKLFINWFLSREGQISFQNAFVPKSRGQMGNSLREDIPKDIIPLESRRDACSDCLAHTPEMLDVTPIINFINEVKAGAKR